MTQSFAIDEALSCGKRSLRTLPQSCLLGPTGARLWADYLLPQPGFCGAIDFIHKVNIPTLFTVKCSEVNQFEPCDVHWYPSHLTMDFKNSKARFTEKKFITWEDCAVSIQTWENCGNEDINLKLDTSESLFQENKGNQFFGGLKVPKHNFTIIAVLEISEPELINGLTLSPGEKLEIAISTALGIEGIDGWSTLKERAGSLVRVDDFEQMLRDHRSAYQSWFDKAPAFSCDEPLLNKTWMYRWFLLRHNLANPNYGNIQHYLFYEGRSHKMSKTPYTPEGWEFSKMIPLTVPMHLLEARWHHDLAYGAGAMRNMKSSQDEEGFYKCLFVNGTLHSYANFMGWAAYQYHLIHRDDNLIREMLPSLKNQIYGEGKKLGNEADKLLIERIHNRTGKEYQPSYWYFHGFPKDCKDPNQFTPLKRVDRSVYHYLNCAGVAQLCKMLSDPDAERIEQLSIEIKEDILHKMWDQDTRFFYDLHFENDMKALVKNVVGFYPYWAQITESDQNDGFRHAFVKEEFNTPCPFPSVSADCPVYQPEGGWQGIFIKGRNGCVWDGPTWPYTNSIVLDAMGLESKRRGHIFDEEFGMYFREFSLLHFSQRNLNMPYLVEHYNSQTGEPISDEVDYNHSYYIDLVIKHIVGLNVEEDRIVLDPVNIGLNYFDLDHVQISGRKIRVTFNKSEHSGSSLPKGYKLYVDGHLVLENDELKRMEYYLQI